MDTLEVQAMRDRIKQFDNLAKQLRYCDEAIAMLEKADPNYDLYLRRQGDSYMMPFGPYSVIRAFKETLIDIRDRLERDIKLL